MSVASVTDGLMIEMLPALPVVDERLPSVDRQTKSRRQMIPATTEWTLSRSRGNTQNYREPVITYGHKYLKRSSHYSNTPTQYFSKGMIIDIWV